MPDTANITDLGEAAALLTLGFDLIKLESLNGAKPFQKDGRTIYPPKVFVFAGTHPAGESTVEATLDLYQRMKLSVDAFSYHRSSKELKTRIHKHSESLSIPD